MRFSRLFLTAVTVIAFVPLTLADWPTFRGADRTGVSADKGLLKKWPEEGPKLIWEAKGAGRGYASPAIAAGKIITLGDGSSAAEDKDEYLTCFDRKTGELVWKTKTGAPWNEGQPDWQGSRSTPTIDGESVYVVTPTGTLLCCKTADGGEVWKKDLKKEFGGDKADIWGYSESPLVDGDVVVVTPGKEKATMVALNKKTGETVWTASRPGDMGAGHASIVISNVGGVKAYINTTGSGVMSVRASDGKLLWTYDFGSKIVAVIPTVILKDDYVFVPIGYKKGAALLKQIPDGEEVKVEEVYGFKVPLANKHGGVVMIGDYVYGDSDDEGNPYCAEWKTGEVKWKERGPAGKRGSIAIGAADGCLYLCCQDGTFALVEANPEEYKVLGSFKLPAAGGRPSWSHPVIDDGKLYVREGDSIYCYDVKG